MKKVIITFCLFFLSFVSTYSQSDIETDCKSNLENIFKILDLKILYETVQHISEKTQISRVSEDDIRGYAERLEINNYFVKSEKRFIPPKEKGKYVEQLKSTPEKALKEYRDFIRNIQLEKLKYLECINAELAKGDSSVYAKYSIFSYSFKPTESSGITFPKYMPKLDFLRFIKEYILNRNEKVLPDAWKADAYFKNGTTIP